MSKHHDPQDIHNEHHWLAMPMFEDETDPGVLTCWGVYTGDVGLRHLVARGMSKQRAVALAAEHNTAVDAALDALERKLKGKKK